MGAGHSRCLWALRWVSMLVGLSYQLKEDIFHLSLMNSTWKRNDSTRGCKKVAGGRSEAKTTG